MTLTLYVTQNIHKLGAEVAEFHFSQNGLSYKKPIRFNNLGIGGIFPLLQNAPSFSTTAHTKTYPLLQILQCALILISSDEAHHVMLQNSTVIFMMGSHDKMRFTSLSYKILELYFMSRLA